MKRIKSAHKLLFSIIVFQFVLSVWLSFFESSLPTGVLYLINDLSLILPFLVYCVFRRENPISLIRVRPISGKTALFAFLAAVCSYPVVVFLNVVSMLFVENAMTDVMAGAFTMGLFPSLLFIAVLPAICEETIFRGVLYNTYSRRRPVAAVFLSALIFGLMHLNFNQMPYAFYLGIVMALLMEASDSILPSMIFHFSINAGSTILSYLSLSGDSSAVESVDFKSSMMESMRATVSQMGIAETTGDIELYAKIFFFVTIEVYAFVAIIFIVLVFGILYALFRTNGRNPKEIFRRDCTDSAYYETKNGKQKKNRMVDGWLIAFLLYAVATCILNAIY